MISIGGRIFGNFFATRHVCVVIHANIYFFKFTGVARSGISSELEIPDFY